MTDKVRKKLFYAFAIVNFIMITIYEFLTPTMSDDVIYADAVAEAAFLICLLRSMSTIWVIQAGA